MNQTTAAILMLTASAVLFAPAASADPYACNEGYDLIVNTNPAYATQWLHVCIENGLPGPCSDVGVACNVVDSAVENASVTVHDELCAHSDCVAVGAAIEYVKGLIP